MATENFDERLDLTGYVLDEDALRDVDLTACRFVAEAEAKRTPSIEYEVVLRGQHTRTYDSLEALSDAISREEPQAIQMKYVLAGATAIRVRFKDDGTVTLSGYSSADTAPFVRSELKERIQVVKEEYSWIVKLLLFKSVIGNIAAGLLALMVFALLIHCGYFLYVKSVGVNIDPALIPRENEPFLRIADALKSQDITKKLDALLSDRLNHFSNAADIASSTERRIILCLFASVILCLFVVLRLHMRKMYPKSYYSIGARRKKIRDRLIVKRQIWSVAIILAFVINVIAGVVVTLMMS